MYEMEMKEGFIKDYMRSRVVAKTSLYSFCEFSVLLNLYSINLLFDWNRFLV